MSLFDEETASVFVCPSSKHCLVNGGEVPPPPPHPNIIRLHRRSKVGSGPVWSWRCLLCSFHQQLVHVSSFSLRKLFRFLPRLLEGLLPPSDAAAAGICLLIITKTEPSGSEPGCSWRSEHTVLTLLFILMFEKVEQWAVFLPTFFHLDLQILSLQRSPKSCSFWDTSVSF